MPSQVRIISRRNSAQWDDLVRDAQSRLGQEHDYYGCSTQDRADHVRRGIRTAAKRAGIGAKVYWKECPEPGKCSNGGADCTHHVYYTLYNMELARAYKAQQAQQRR